MSQSWVDQLGRSIGESTSRREALLAAGAGLAALVVAGGSATPVEAVGVSANDTCQRRARKCRRQMSVYCNEEWHAMRRDCRQATYRCCSYYGDCDTKRAQRCKKSSSFLNPN